MLYHRLLSSLLQPETAPLADQVAEPPFSWSRLYADLSLDPTAPLSNGFLDSIAPVIQGSSLEESLGDAETLGDFVAVMMKYAEMVRGGRQHVLEDEVEVVYRMRGSSSGSAWRSPPASAATQTVSVASEDADLQRATAASLAEPVDSQSSESTSGGYTSILDILTKDELDAELRVGMTSFAQEPPVADSQLEDSQQPFLANPSLPLPVDHLPPSYSGEAPSSDPAPFALPLNSQGREEDYKSTPAAGSTRSSRYYLRSSRTAHVSAPTETVAPDPPSLLPQQGPLLDDRPTASPAASSSAATSLATPSQRAVDPGFIGVEKIKVDAEELSAWLASITAYWKGEREPIGVTVTQVNRCRCVHSALHPVRVLADSLRSRRFCEFEDGCEWRAAQAKLAMEEAQARRVARAAAA